LAVGERERTDLNVEQPAKYLVDGMWFRTSEVYSDSRDRRRRDIFVNGPEGRLPETAEVKYKGRRYTGELSFRTTGSGASVPVYEFYTETPYYT